MNDDLESPLPQWFPHRVPRGVVIPNDALTCRRYEADGDQGITVVERGPANRFEDAPRWSETPFKRLLPTNAGDQIFDVVLRGGVIHVPSMTLDKRGLWWGMDTDLVMRQVNADSNLIVDWSDKALDPMDESCHRDRMFSNGMRITHRRCGRWHIQGNVNEDYTPVIRDLKCSQGNFCSADYTLIGWMRTDGDIQFASKQIGES